MQEVKAESAVNIEEVAGGVIITVPGGHPPIFPTFMMFVFAIVSVVLGVTEAPAYFIGTICLILAAVFAFKMHGKEQVVKIIDGKLITEKKTFEISNISAIELGNEFESTSLLRSNSIIVTRGSLGMATGVAVGSMVGGAAMGLANLSIKSGAKKAYLVRIQYGEKKYVIANKMREVKATALFHALAGN